MKLTSILPLLASLAAATTLKYTASPTAKDNEISLEPKPDTWAPLYSVDPSVLKITGGSISPFPTTLIKLAASVPTASAATEPSPALLPKYVAREFQNPEDKFVGIKCNTTRHGYEGPAGVRPHYKGYEYLWKLGSYWVTDPGDHDRTPEKKVIALARVADLARDIGSKCYYGFDSINGEVTDAGGLVIVVSGADC